MKRGSAGLKKPLSGYRLTDVASCRHFFRCLDTDGIMRDGVGGVTLASGAALSTGGNLLITYDSDLMSLSNNMTNGVNPVAVGGAWATFGDGKAILAIYCGRVTTPADVRFAMGDVNGTMGGPAYGIGLPGNTAPHIAVKGPNGTNKYVQSGLSISSLNGGGGYTPGLTAAHAPGTNGTGVLMAAPTLSGGVITAVPFIHAGYDFILGTDPVKNGTIDLSQVGVPPATYTVSAGLAAGLGSYHVGKDVMILAKYTPGDPTYLSAFDAENGTEYFRCTTESGTTAFDVGAFTPDAYLRWSGLSLYGAAVFEFDAIPADWWPAALWMAGAWKNGDKYLWPGWA